MEIIAEGNSVLKELKNQIKEEGLVYVSYEVTMNEQWVLSLNISTELGRDRIIRNTYYFNFDLHTGEEIKIDDIIARDQKDSFQKKVLTDKIDSLKEYRKQKLTLLLDNPNDSDTYKWALEESESCMSEVHLETFSLDRRFIELIDPCEFPTVIRSEEPDYHLKYPFKTYYYILNEKYRNIFKPIK